MSSRSSRPSPLHARVGVALLAGLLLAPLGAAGARADEPAPAAPATPSATSDPSSPALSVLDTPRELAEQALAAVQQIVSPDDAPAVPAPAPAPSTTAAPAGGKDLTLALRDLALRKADLAPADRRTAARLLARPTDSRNGTGDGNCTDEGEIACYTTTEQRPVCGPTICVHYVATTKDAATLTYAQQVLTRMEGVASQYVAAGYRRPLPDGTTGDTAGNPSGRFDVYLADLNVPDLGQLYGFCAPEVPTQNTLHTTSTAYCALDNDFAASQFGTANSPAENLAVTAAHEFFHAIQFAYDVGEDTWIVEATATWAEDQLFDSVNDNLQYLPFGPLGRPQQRLDSSFGITPYGSWIFFRYLSERFPRAQAGLPVIIRRIWEFLGARRYSVQGVALALRELRTDLPLQFSYFTAWNRQPRTYYSEGASYRPAPLRLSYRIGASASRTTTFDLEQLSAKHFRYTPSMSGAWTLRVRVNMSSIAAGGSAIITVKPRGKAPYLRKMALNASGDGVLAVPFGSRVDWIELDAINASTRFARCGSLGTNTDATCQGVPVDNGLKQGVIVRAVRG
ncbi:MXAN_6640 family putative metalloprotease [Nocardioides sp.]|uniref:MXAN_6640 family putative metalloprotease n=1 Tax=Nocardioides sp. TaxID=35761 RepID=UPI0035157B70